MKYAKIENGVVVQTQPYNENGFVIVPDNTGCGMMWDGYKLSIPTVVLTEQEQIIELERQITPRRVREAILGTDNGWLVEIERKISVLRLK